MSPVRSLTTTMVLDGKNGDARSPPARFSKKTFTDDLYSTFSSPLAWILVLALVITWSFVFVIMFDLTDYKTITGQDGADEAEGRVELPVATRLVLQPQMFPLSPFSLFLAWSKLQILLDHVFHHQPPVSLLLLSYKLVLTNTI